MSEVKSYTGSCHCGDVRYEVELALDQVIACNCSICSRVGYLLAFAPATQFTLLSGEESLKDYQFGKKQIHHTFCSRCGVHAFGGGTSPQGVEMRSINVRCLHDVDASSLPVTPVDGKSL